MNDFIIIGGGNSGYISALMLKKSFPKRKVTVIRSSKIGIIGVGESSTEHFGDFCEYCDINTCDLILNTKATFKNGVYFSGWSDEDFLHAVNLPHHDQFHYLHHVVANNRPNCEMNYCGSWDNKVPLSYFNSMNHTPTRQFHFDTAALNEYLEQLCLKNGIDVIEDKLETAGIDSKTGNITSVIGERKYYSKFFIDCSGFCRFLLKETLGIKWKSYSEYLPLNSAITYESEEMEEYNMYTKSTARESGWTWEIPTQGRTGNGYVYCDRYEPVIERDVTKKFKFDPGRMEKAWHKNCYAVGLSQSFVEPLEATSLGSVIQQMFAFINYYPSNSIDECNEIVNKIFDNIFDYVQAHYLTQREDTPFWKEVKYNLKITPSLQELLDTWKRRFPQSDDVMCRWGMFTALNYIPILYGLKWFDKKRVAKEYKVTEKSYSWEETRDRCLHIGHKNFITEVVKTNE